MPWQLQRRFARRQQQQKPFWPVNSERKQKKKERNKKIQPRVDKEDQTEEAEMLLCCVSGWCGGSSAWRRSLQRELPGRNAAERQAGKGKKKKDTQTVNKPREAPLLTGDFQAGLDPARIAARAKTKLPLWWRRAQFDLHLQRCNRHPPARRGANH